MRATISRMPTEARKNSFFSSFKDSKRVRWAASRNYTR